ncbi:hypothetical protein [Cellulomonas sp.]|uniref:hypothetical protein n=1 Tax=Cellulomonas sp. TaxID=40001 RepID=UPI002810EC2B|nr:hypothetical protein [Cellulomonas sp.]
MEVDAAARLWPTTDVVGLVVRESSPLRMLGWPMGSRAMYELPAVPGAFAEGRPSLCPGGRAVLLDLDVSLADGPGEADRRARGTARVDLTTGDTAHLWFDGFPESKSGATVGGSPDGSRVGIAWTWLERALDASAWPVAVLRLYLATFDGAPARELATITGGMATGINLDDVPVQWSPDGTRVAFSVARQVQGPGGVGNVVRETHVYDAVNGVEVQRAPGTLCGSASWGPGSDLLLIDHDLDDTWVYDLRADTAREVSVLPPSAGRDMRPQRALGLADEDHLITCRQRGERTTISLMNLADGTTAEILSYSYEEARYPVIAALPRGTWTPQGGVAP